MSEPKFKRGDIVTVTDTCSPFHDWAGPIVGIHGEWYQVNAKYLGWSGCAMCLRFRSDQIKGVD